VNQFGVQKTMLTLMTSHRGRSGRGGYGCRRLGRRRVADQDLEQTVRCRFTVKVPDAAQNHGSSGLAGRLDIVRQNRRFRVPDRLQNDAPERRPSPSWPQRRTAHPVWFTSSDQWSS